MIMYLNRAVTTWIKVRFCRLSSVFITTVIQLKWSFERFTYRILLFAGLRSDWTPCCCRSAWCPSMSWVYCPRPPARWERTEAPARQNPFWTEERAWCANQIQGRRAADKRVHSKASRFQKRTGSLPRAVSYSVAIAWIKTESAILCERWRSGEGGMTWAHRSAHFGDASVRSRSVECEAERGGRASEGTICRASGSSAAAAILHRMLHQISPLANEDGIPFPHWLSWMTG